MIKKVIILVVGVVVLMPQAAAAVSKEKINKVATALYNEEKYAEAIELYRDALAGDPESPILNYNLGTAYYKQGDYEKSARHMQKALLSEDNVVRQKAYYNIANAYYKYGINMEEANIGKAIEMLESSLSDYERALKIDDKDQDAQYNYEFVKQQIERLKEKQKKEQEKNKQEQEQQKKEETQEEKTTEEEKQKEQQKDSSQEDSKDKQKDKGRDSGDEEKELENQESQAEEQQDEEQKSKQPDKSEASEDSPQPSEELSEKEAERLLNEYQRKEEPKGLLNFMKRKGKEAPVMRDW